MIAKISVSVKEKGGKKAPDWTLEGDLRGELTLVELFGYTKNALISISSDALKEEQGKGFDKKPLVLVDGKYNKNVADVHPLGKIQYVSRQNLAEVILFAYQAVWERSPIGKKEEYLRSNVLTYNGTQVANNLSSVKTWLESKVSYNDKDKIRIVNTAPYARKLELNGVRFGAPAKKRWGKPGSAYYKSKTMNDKGQVRKPNGAYALAAKSIKHKYGRNAFIKYELLIGSKIGLVGPGRVRKTGKDKGRSYVYPSILIYAVDASNPT